MKIEDYLNTLKDTLYHLDQGEIRRFKAALWDAYDNNRQIFVFGNGGSGSTASHFCCDFVKGVADNGFKMHCLNDNMPLLMAIANDISYDDIFIIQLKNLMKSGDLVIGISGSGNSMNVVKAMKYARDNGAITVAMCGYNGGKIKGIADIPIHINIDNMQVVEDMHLMVMHCLKSDLYDELHKE
jgi:D-sedoheptulose 7-phosphate isomerase